MLFALAVLIGGTVLFTGPVQAVVNFYRIENRTVTDSLLCPNTTYTFVCEISGAEIQLRSRGSDGSTINAFSGATATAGSTSPQSDFNFTSSISVNGLLTVTAVMDSSVDFSSVELECTDLDDMNVTTLSTVVKRDPLDAPNPDCLHVTCVVCNYDVTFIKVTWEAVDCAQSYVLDIYDIYSNTTTSTAHQGSYDVLAPNISGSLYATGGYASSFFQECSVVFTTSPPPPECPAFQPDAPGFQVIPFYESSCCGATETGYNITLTDSPPGTTAYYVTSHDSVEDMNIINDFVVIYDLPVTVYIVCADGTVYNGQELQEPTLSGGHLCCFWRLLAILLIVALFILLCAFFIMIIVMCVIWKTKVATQGKLHASAERPFDESEMKLRGSDM